jgi:hypothetical protein
MNKHWLFVTRAEQQQVVFRDGATKSDIRTVIKRATFVDSLMQFWIRQSIRTLRFVAYLRSLLCTLSELSQALLCHMPKKL